MCIRDSIRYQDGTPLYYYDITSRQPLSRLLETRSITRDEICQIVIQLHVTLMRMEEYLLSDGGILLNQDPVSYTHLDVYKRQASYGVWFQKRT